MLKQALCVVEEMLEDRKYIPISCQIFNTDVIQRVNHSQYLTPNNKLAIVIVVESTSDIKTFSKYLKDPEFETIIFIYQNNITITHQAIEKNLCHKIEIWSVNSLLVNTKRHYLQPKVELAESFKYEGKLPKICFYDPIVRYYKFPSKSILKITNKDGFIHYRIVM